MFDPVDPRQSFPALEKGILHYWKEEDTFRRSIDQRKAGEHFGFYDGPPFATGLPHYGHLLAGTIKDVIPRYQTMRGKAVERRFGWDCHGLPVEYEIEKEHGLKSRRDIENMGVARFNELCRGIVQRYAKEWRTTVERMGRWVDMDHDYRTMDSDYMESIWWVFAQLFEKNLIYEGHKPMHVCPRCVTPLSNFEVTQGYKDITDQSAFVMFELREKQDTFVLAWTTTPWTLPGNLFLAVGKDIAYVTVELDGKKYILAEERVEGVFKDREHTVGKSVKAKDLIGKKYVPLFPYFVDAYDESAFEIVEGDFVTTEDGTGVVHIAPGFGEDDYKTGQKMKVPLLQHVTMDGRFIEAVTDFAGQEVKPADDPSKTDRKVTEWLEKHGKLFKKESYTHSYPHCWRCDSPLLNYATSSWFVKVENIKEDMLAANAETTWIPAHIRDGRFGKWLENARDWAISRNRYWGTPLPIWRCDATKEIDIVGSRDELMKRHSIRFTKLTVLRHAQSEGNVSQLFQGVPPGTDLTPLGRKQAAAGAAQTGPDVAVIYCSPLARTMQTAQAVADATGAKIIVDDRLKETQFGEHEGTHYDFDDLNFAALKRKHKIEQNAIESIYHLPGMETWSDVQARIDNFLNDVLPKHRSEHIVVVTHADPIKHVRHYFTKEDPMKLSHQPFADYATPYVFFHDHDRESEIDLHKHIVDDIVWPSPDAEMLADAVFVRHGETDLNKRQIMQGGNVDAPLNDTGRAQALEAAKKLKQEKYDLIVSSDLSRASETAEIIAKELNIPYAGGKKSLRERDAGAWSGRPVADVFAELGTGMTEKDPNIAFHYRNAPEGETLSHFLARCRKAYVELSEEYKGKKILVVAHRGVLQAFLAFAGNLSYAEAAAMKPGNAEAVEIPLKPLVRRIPEVLDCWFESGSMPYAQAHFPFEATPTLDREKTPEDAIEPIQEKSKKGLPPNFPADFIAEGIDQTRGWFYTLTVLSSALFKKPPFYNCIVNGTVLAEDGRKMSKRLKNYPDPGEVIERHGADALRFALMNSPAVRAEDVRFSERTVEETVRNVLLPLWNSYGFFVTYANAANFEPVTEPRPSSHPLDKWIKAEVQDLTNRMTRELDAYNLSGTCNELFDTIDALTNWYIRLSRRRFAGKGVDNEAFAEHSDEERREALTTLYDVLTTISQLLAPFCPFVTETMYLNLVGEEHGSVHLTNWPETRELTKEEQALLAKNRLLRRIVSLGLQVRSMKKIKVRQPLSKVTVAVPESVLKRHPIDAEDITLIKNELNVKEVVFADDPGTLGERIAMVNARTAGPRLGKRVQEIIMAGKRGEFTMQDDGTILILDETLTPDEATIVYKGNEGNDIAAEEGTVVALDSTITEELKREGLARDLIRAIQKLRKESGYDMGETVEVHIRGADDVLKDFSTLIVRETNITLTEKQATAHDVEIGDGEKVVILMDEK